MSTTYILLSGGHSGIGLELTKMLLSKENYHLGLIIRSPERQAQLSEELREAKNIDFFYSDLSDQASVKALGETINNSWPKVDVLFNNAGVLLDDFYTSKQGNEMHLEVNTLAPHYLTLSLKPSFKKADDPVVVNTVTGGLHNRKSIDIKVFEQGSSFKKLFGAYLQSKLALSLLSQDWNKEIPTLRVVNVNPGPNKTKMTADSGMPIWLLPLRNLFFQKPIKGAKLLYQGAFDEKHKKEKFALLNANKKASLAFRLSDRDKAILLRSPE
ncbi:MAG: SDR family NAD(P)-dependent oxidoreductase [Bacteroidota bacterium]